MGKRLVRTVAAGGNRGRWKASSCWKSTLGPSALSRQWATTSGQPPALTISSQGNF